MMSTILMILFQLTSDRTPSSTKKRCHIPSVVGILTYLTPVPHGDHRRAETIHNISHRRRVCRSWSLTAVVSVSW